MPRRLKPPSLTYAQLQRQLKDVLKSEGEWVDRYTALQDDLSIARRAHERIRQQLGGKDVEIARLQGYIDRVLDEDRRLLGPIAGKGPTRPPLKSDSLDSLRYDIVDEKRNLNDFSQDEIERITGRDEDD